jgi:hypothetical protein
VRGGDLSLALREAGGRTVEEDAVNVVLRPLLSALAYLHTQVRTVCALALALWGEAACLISGDKLQRCTSGD